MTIPREVIEAAAEQFSAHVHGEVDFEALTDEEQNAAFVATNDIIDVALPAIKEELGRWKERWSATLADADKQRAEKKKAQLQYVDVVIAIRALHRPIYLKDLWGNVGPHNEDLQVCRSCSNDRDYVLYPCPTHKIVDGA